MRKSWIGLIGLTAALTIAGCSDKPPHTEPDVGPDADVDPPDSDTDIPPGSLHLADPCANNDQCSSGLCVTLGQGINDSLCSQRCNNAESCGDASAWDCTEVDSALNDTISVCVPKGLCLDLDNDGYGVGPGCAGPDCDDNEPTVYFGAQELCDGLDNDCNGEIDDHTGVENLSCDTGLEGVCKTGFFLCEDGVAVCQVVTQPGSLTEICNGLDDDCDGLTDESRLDDNNNNYVPNTGQPCSAGGAGCENGITTCDPERGVICLADTGALDDSCDGVDNDCDGTIDNDVPNLNRPCSVGEGVCLARGITVCDSHPAAPPVCNAVADNSKATTEVCDYEDNNCDGETDEGFVNAQGVYVHVDHCGACDLSCSDFWAENDYAHTVVPTCPAGSCTYTCVAPWVDMDGEASNGCETKPDPKAIYVAPENKGGEDVGFCGTYNRPCASINHAIGELAQDSSPFVTRNIIIVAEGIYRETIELPNGVSLKGGHNANNWLRDVEEYRTIVIGVSSGTTILAENITSPTEISGLTIIGEDGQNGANSIAVLVRNSTNALTIRDNVIRAGLGGQGSSGQAGQDGEDGKQGGVGIGAQEDAPMGPRSGGAGGESRCKVPGAAEENVRGGSGAGVELPIYGGSGLLAQAGTGVAGGTPGLSAAGRGLLGAPGEPGALCFPKPDKMNESIPSDGANGSTGVDGTGGAGASNPSGELIGGVWKAQAGSVGVHGGHGSGGGGGGASHGTLQCTGSDANGSFTGCTTVLLVGASGGGGGAGGCAGAAAAGGGGGGASIALYIYNASASASLPVIQNNILERNGGGQGGDGGIAGRGGDGGNGGIGGTGATPGGQNFCPQDGRSGGNGGRGGHGGGGGGGAGGISYDIAIFGPTANTAQLAQDNQFGQAASANTGGNGGPGGGSMGRPGLSGVAGSFGNIYNP